MLLFAGMLAGCAKNYQKYEDFIAVVAAEGDTLDSIAARHLGDASLAWKLAEYNNITSVAPGQRLVVPLKPFRRGGLEAGGMQTVPVLSYHNLAETRTNLMTVPRASFEAQMKFLAENGYTVITMDQFLDFMEFQEPVPDKSVVITFDDGWRSLYTIGWPVLRKYGFPATVFVYTDLIVGSSKTLSWQELARMRDQGLDIQCHTVTHRNLGKQAKGETFKDYMASVEKEIDDSRRIIKTRLGIETDCMAYPYGATNSLVSHMLRRRGFRAGFTVERDPNPFYVNNFRINRSMIYGTWGLDKFKRQLDVFHKEWLK
jgi:peptidoglycan/xylan/chitin deacetylase (PgdA/CDA1 family)